MGFKQNCSLHRKKKLKKIIRAQEEQMLYTQSAQPQDGTAASFISA